MYIKVRHLQPYLANDWRKRLPCDLKNVTDNTGKEEMFPMIWGVRKEFPKPNLEVQKRLSSAILLISDASETLYNSSEESFFVETSYMHLVWISIFFLPDHFKVDSFDDLPQHFLVQEKHVAVFGARIKQLVALHDRFLVCPHKSLPGIDYVVHLRKTKPVSSAKMAKSKQNATLYLCEVAPGTAQQGDVIGRALNVMKRVFSDVNVSVHVVVIIVRNKRERIYTVTRCNFENVTILNLCEEDSKDKVLKKFLFENKLLYKLYQEPSDS